MAIALLGVVLVSQILGIGDPSRWVRTFAASAPVRGASTRLLGPADPGRRLFIGAVVIGALLRVLWVIWATRTPTGLRDPAEYLRIASDFGHGVMPRFGGLDHSAYWPPGYPALLAPFVAVADRTGWISPAFVAALVNAAAGTATIVLTGVLAEHWMGIRARPVAAWLVAICPALVFWTATAHTETVFTAMLLGVIVLCTRAAADGSLRRWVLAGLLLGAAFLVRSPAVIALVIPALTIRARRGSWRGAARATGLVAATAALVLVPWMIRNGIQVGVWTPASTNNAGAACFGHHDDAQGRWEPGALTERVQIDCFGGSPFADRRLLPLYGSEGVSLPPGQDWGEPDEPRWYRDSMIGAVEWALGHPTEEARLSARKLWATWGDEGPVVDGARNYAEPGWAGRWHDPLGVAADLWLWIVGGLALVGLVLVPGCRRASPIWAPIALLTLAIVGGVAEPHYRYPVEPLLAVLAAGLLCRRSVGVTS